MIREFIYTKPFLVSWKKMGLSDTELKILEDALLNNPQLGDVIQGTGGARKMRIQLGEKGKSGGGRVIYIDVFEREKTYLLLAYPKNIQEDLTPAQLRVIKEIVDMIKKE